MTPFPIQSPQRLAEKMMRRLNEVDRPMAVSREAVRMVTASELLILLGLRRARFAFRSPLHPPVHSPPKPPESGEEKAPGSGKSDGQSLSPDPPKPKPNKNTGTQNPGGIHHGTEE